MLVDDGDVANQGSESSALSNKRSTHPTNGLLFSLPVHLGSFGYRLVLTDIHKPI